MAAPDLPLTTTVTVGSTAPEANRVDLTGVDACSVVPAGVVSQLGYRPPISAQQRVGVTKFVCGYRVVESGVGTSLFLDTGHGSDQYDTTSGGRVASTIQLDAYPALVIADRSLDACTVSVDVAPAQSLTTVTTTNNPEQPVSELCDRSRQFAAAALTALGTR